MQIQKSALLSFSKIALSSILALLVSACTHGSQKTRTTVQEIKPSETLQSYTWHDGSTDGAYGIGEGWSFEILPAEYKDVIETFFHGPSTRYDIVPAEYEWVKETVTTPNVVTSPRIELVIFPGTFETIGETYITKPTKPQYSLLPPVYNAEGDLVTQAAILQKENFAQTAIREFKILTGPERIIKKTVSFEPRQGYTLLEIKPAEVREIPRPQESSSVTNWVEVHPMQVVIKSPNGDIAHIFDILDFFGFLRSLD